MALVGVAFLNQDSGQLRGEPCTWGGRAFVRKSLYMTTVTAIHHNSTIRAFHTRFCEQGKPKKVAPVTAMDKQPTVLNAVSRDRLPWQTGPLSTVIHT